MYFLIFDFLRILLFLVKTDILLFLMKTYILSLFLSRLIFEIWTQRHGNFVVGSPFDVMANVLSCDLEVSEFER